LISTNCCDLPAPSRLGPPQLAAFSSVGFATSA
jgi:hypothetical protein